MAEKKQTVTNSELLQRENAQNESVTVGTPPKAVTKNKKRRGARRPMTIKRDATTNKVTILDGKSVISEHSPALTIFVVASIVVLALFLLMNYAELEKLNSDVGELEAEITSLKTEKKALETELEKSVDLAFIEEYATTVLGMQKPDKKYPISLRPADDINVTQYPDQPDEVRTDTIFSGFAEVFRNFITGSDS